MNTQHPIGVFDSGVGGLTVLHALSQTLAHENFIYLGDTARLPYGIKSPETVMRYAEQATSKLIEQGIKLMVVACNTATALALSHLQQTFPSLPIVGVVEPGAQAACQATRSKEIIVIGTEGTIKHKAYEKAIAKRCPDIKVISRSCSLFVPLAEEGWLTGPIAEAIVREYLEPLLGQANTHPDCLVLGCTHFPTLLPTIKNVVGPQITIVDSAHTTAKWVEELLITSNLLNTSNEPSTTRFLATDSPERFAKIASRFLGKQLTTNDVELVDI